ncbi:hypothetical protein [Streptomyces sp. NPDC060027]|uniref:hypothetical protein n=1 Tax=Streptomyces sp. NPDC060027 TaxID=3347040 RepID=UPI0036AFF2F6
MTGPILSQFEDADWVQIFRGLVIVLIASVLIGLIRPVRARMAVYVYDRGVAARPGATSGRSAGTR